MEDLNNKSIWALKGAIERLIEKIDELVNKVDVLPQEERKEEEEKIIQLSIEDIIGEEPKEEETIEDHFDKRAFSKLLNSSNKVNLDDNMTFRTRCKWEGIMLWSKTGLTYKEAIEYRNSNLNLLLPAFEKAFKCEAFKCIEGYENITTVAEAFERFKEKLNEKDRNFFKKGGKDNGKD